MKDEIKTITSWVKDLVVYERSDKQLFISIPDEFDGCAPFESSDVKGYFMGKYIEETGKSIGLTKFNSYMEAAKAIAKRHAQKSSIFTRCGVVDGVLYYRLGGGRYAKLDPNKDAPKIVVRKGLPFYHSRTFECLPEPVFRSKGYLGLKSIVNVRNRDLYLVLSWLMAGFMPEGAKPLLVLTGRQGSAKSTTLRMLKKLIDPSGAPLRTLSGSERDLLISAERNHVMAFDNISSLTATMSDALCRLATGSGFATRKLYADAEEFVIEAQALVCLNGIGDFVLRNDLISRSILLDTPEITLTSRKTEAKINSLLETKRPEILGALLMGAHHAFKSYKTTKVANLGRMADFTVWTAAWSRNLIPDQSDMILQMLKDNAKESLAVALNTDAINLPILKLAAKSGPNGWSGTPQELLDAIAILVADDSIIKGKWWPKSASELGKRIERIAPGLLEQGVTVERTRTSEGRYITIIMKSEVLRDKYNAEISLHTHKRRVIPPKNDASEK